ncbi:hypothetical protein MYX07_07155 [Patescibacteria group bacterium AH-259-L07]|nr:hypothetical protein [Patescibacteria group bacterium AH-259-L07]
MVLPPADKYASRSFLTNFKGYYGGKKMIDKTFLSTLNTQSRQYGSTRDEVNDRSGTARKDVKAGNFLSVRRSST